MRVPHTAVGSHTRLGVDPASCARIFCGSRCAVVIMILDAGILCRSKSVEESTSQAGTQPDALSLVFSLRCTMLLSVWMNAARLPKPTRPAKGQHHATITLSCSNAQDAELASLTQLPATRYRERSVKALAGSPILSSSENCRLLRQPRVPVSRRPPLAGHEGRPW